MLHRLLLLGLVAALAPGCITALTVIKLNPSGSGTIEQTMLVNPRAFESLSMMAGQMGGGDRGTSSALPSPQDMLDEAKLKEAAAKFGSGVRFVSATPLNENGMEGARAIFAFDDINTLALDQSPGGAGRTENDQLTFRLQQRPGGTSVLTVTLPETDRDESSVRQAPSSPGPGQLPPEAMALVKQFLDGLRVAVDVEVAGTLVKTNADHVSGSRVTLLDIDFAPLLADPSAFEKLSALGPGAKLNDVTPLLKDVPGIKVNSSPVTIEFR